MMNLRPVFKSPATMPRAPNRQRGAVAIIFAASLILILGFIGLALDLSRLYNRKIELQMVADAAALAGARMLVGTPGGIDEAIAAAGAAAAKLKYNYRKSSVAWSASAVRFGASPTGSAWIDAAAARVKPDQIFFVRVDTAQLDPAMGSIDTVFLNVVKADLVSANTSASAVAGRSTLNVLPLGICAMSPMPATSRPPNAELVEYGFRRGVAYDLMQLNPNGTTAENFVINPIDTMGGPGSAANTTAAIVGPFVCTGKMPVPGIGGSRLKVSRPFPLDTLVEHLNSRFDQFNGGSCSFRSAPPDYNIKSYLYTSVAWMKNTPPTVQTAKSTTSGGKLRTIADLDPDPSHTAPLYGPLWSYAKPIPFAAYMAGVTEPDNFYPPFLKSLWPALYAPGLPEANSSYPGNTPYATGAGAMFAAPASAHGSGVRRRRVLNVPLLECPIAAGFSAEAKILAIGRFFMTVPATDTSISAEFAGTANEAALGGAVELYK
jgi:Flp pilus assembly protein TadG